MYTSHTKVDIIMYTRNEEGNLFNLSSYLQTYACTKKVDCYKINYVCLRCYIAGVQSGQLEPYYSPSPFYYAELILSRGS